MPNAVQMREVAEQALGQGLTVCVIFDPLADGSLVNDFFLQCRDPEYRLLFQGTPLEHLSAQSPYLWRLRDVEDPFFNSLPGRKESWGFVCMADAPLELCLEHWQSLLLVNSGQGGRTHLRFYDGDILIRLLRAMDAPDAANFMGPHCRAVVEDRQAPEGGPPIFVWEHHKLRGASPADIAGEYVPRRGPWWTFTGEYRALFADRLEAVLRHNAVERMHALHPARAGALQLGEDLGAFASRHLGRARELGLDEPESLLDFVLCCLLHGEDFPNDPALREASATPEGRDAFAAMINRLSKEDANV